MASSPRYLSRLEGSMIKWPLVPRDYEDSPFTSSTMGTDTANTENNPTPANEPSFLIWPLATGVNCASPYLKPGPMTFWHTLLRFTIRNLRFLIQFPHSDPEASSEIEALIPFKYGVHTCQQGLPYTMALSWQQAECPLTIHIGDANKFKYGNDDKGIGGSIGVHKLKHVDSTLAGERNSHHQTGPRGPAPSSHLC